MADTLEYTSVAFPRSRVSDELLAELEAQMGPPSLVRAMDVAQPEAARAGFAALVAGIIWGSKLGVQFSLSQVALKALPVVILGGLTSVPGAIIGGLLVGVGEKLSEVFIGPYFGGGIEIWFAYVLALGFLLVRPQGLFGEKIIDRV